jgi:hypothetical protein
MSLWSSLGKVVSEVESRIDRVLDIQPGTPPTAPETTSSSSSSDPPNSNTSTNDGT